MRESVIALANSQGEFKQLGMLLMDMLATSDDWDTFRKYFDARRKKEPQKEVRIFYHELSTCTKTKTTNIHHEPSPPRKLDATAVAPSLIRCSRMTSSLVAPLFWGRVRFTLIVCK